ncbi:Glycosyltransferase involved in cell wall bisynthesis [Marinobacter sp. es.042]|uniref:glycosyltransferase family 4 protein n=1 Tax=Marinobacter sp. es.042 TaxID=1761794 RepID=UPI000B510288|nr:glycosyltransferase family 4 protein [Marinobacter sp. es.042]SNB55487.1 Glycosyltransferase involved in cell wall bisynthesis [Marinobacter sp. es.042]
MEPTVLHVIDTTGPGGAETVFLDLAEECMRRGYGSIALIRGPGWVEDQLKRRGIPYEVRESKGSMNLRFLLALISLVRRYRVTHIQSHLLGSNVYTSLVGMFLNIPVVSVFHGHVDISDKERFRNAKMAIIRAGSRHVVSVTDDLKQSINRTTNGWSRLNATVIPNGIDVRALETLPIKSLDKGNENVVFGCLGNIRPAKNYRLAVDFITLLQREGLNAVLRIAGDDSKPEAEELKQYCIDSGLESSVEFLGFIDNVPEFMDAIDIFLMTSTTEGHPLALTQALSAGKPVISTRNGIEKLVPEDLVFLAKEDTPEALAESKNVLLGTEQLNELLARGRKYVRENYSLSVMFARYFQLYELRDRP